MRTDLHTPTRHRGFTLIDLMITIVILGILAGIVLPILANYTSNASDAAAKTTYSSVRKALDLSYTNNGAWPAAITADLFVNSEMPTLPAGYTLNYTPATGDLALVMPTP